MIWKEGESDTCARLRAPDETIENVAASDRSAWIPHLLHHLM